MTKSEVLAWVRNTLPGILGRHDVSIITLSVNKGVVKIVGALTNLPTNGLELDIQQDLTGASNLTLRGSIYTGAEIMFSGDLCSNNIRLDRGEMTFSLDKEMANVWFFNRGEVVCRNAVTGEERSQFTLPPGQVVEQLY